MDLFNQLHLNPRNPQTYTDDDIELLKVSIRDFPRMLELRPIIYDKDFMIIGGSKRYIAIQGLLPEGFVVKPEYLKSAEDLTPEQIKEFIIKDNVEVGEWDNIILKEDFADVPLESWGLDDIEVEVEDVAVNTADLSDPTATPEQTPTPEPAPTKPKKTACALCAVLHKQHSEIPAPEKPAEDPVI